MSKVLATKTSILDEMVNLEEMECEAVKRLPSNARDYYVSGANGQQTLSENKLAYKRLRIRPRCLVDVSKWDMETTVLGERVSLPIGISPTAMQKMAHPMGELANAQAAERMGTVFILSTIATSSIEEVAQAAPNAIKWFQLYVYNDRSVTLNLVQRAEKAGFKAIVLTVDTPLFGVRNADIKNKFALPHHLTLANFSGELSHTTNQAVGDGSSLASLSRLFDSTLDWNIIGWLKSVTSLPIVVKGVIRGDDALKAHAAGATAVLVSNHGARQLDGVPATIEALPEVVKALDGRNMEVYLDGGITEGTDVYKALALGAKMVFVGRPALWGLTLAGREGVIKMLQILRTELQFAIMLAGTPTLTDITKDMVVHHSVYSKL